MYRGDAHTHTRFLAWMADESCLPALRVPVMAPEWKASKQAFTSQTYSLSTLSFLPSHCLYLLYTHTWTHTNTHTGGKVFGGGVISVIADESRLCQSPAPYVVDWPPLRSWRKSGVCSNPSRGDGSMRLLVRLLYPCLPSGRCGAWAGEVRICTIQPLSESNTEQLKAIPAKVGHLSLGVFCDIMQWVIHDGHSNILNFIYKSS